MKIKKNIKINWLKISGGEINVAIIIKIIYRRVLNLLNKFKFELFIYNNIIKFKGNCKQKQNLFIIKKKKLRNFKKFPSKYILLIIKFKKKFHILDNIYI